MRTKLLVPILGALLACSPALKAPRESLRISGTVQGGKGPLPVEIRIYESCTPGRFGFEQCPGSLLGEAKIKKPGSFVVEVDTEVREISVVARRGSPGLPGEECAELTLPVSQAAKPLQLTLAQQPCPAASGRP